MTPSVGRIVHYKNEHGHLLAAIITCVWSDERVNLTVFYPDGSTGQVSRASCGDDVGRWNWPARV